MSRSSAHPDRARSALDTAAAVPMADSTAQFAAQEPTHGAAAVNGPAEEDAEDDWEDDPEHGREHASGSDDDYEEEEEDPQRADAGRADASQNDGDGEEGPERAMLEEGAHCQLLQKRDSGHGEWVDVQIAGVVPQAVAPAAPAEDVQSPPLEKRQRRFVVLFCHPRLEKERFCSHLMRDGKCKFGQTCRFSHGWVFLRSLASPHSGACEHRIEVSETDLRAHDHCSQRVLHRRVIHKGDIVLAFWRWEGPQLGAPHCAASRLRTQRGPAVVQSAHHQYRRQQVRRPLCRL
jgi:hypothetical protein